VAEFTAGGTGANSPAGPRPGSGYAALMPAHRAARPRLSAGALFRDSHGRVLLVNPTYKNKWNFPGGGVDKGESPYQACVREVREELGITPPIGALLATGWRGRDGRSGKLFFVFDGGELDPASQAAIRLDPVELSEHLFADPDRAVELVPGWLGQLLTTAVAAHAEQTARYVELAPTTPIGAARC